MLGLIKSLKMEAGYSISKRKEEVKRGKEEGEGKRGEETHQGGR